jgi:PAS domain-containing protein
MHASLPERLGWRPRVARAVASCTTVPAGGDDVAQEPIELILMRELAELLATPIFLVDGAGRLVFYNEPAEDLLGQRFDETGPMAAEEWSTAFGPLDTDGTPMAPADLPLVVALREGHATHDTFDIRGLDGIVRRLEATGIPLLDTNGQLVGAAALFWLAER